MILLLGFFSYDFTKEPKVKSNVPWSQGLLSFFVITRFLMFKKCITQYPHLTQSDSLKQRNYRFWGILDILQNIIFVCFCN